MRAIHLGRWNERFKHGMGALSGAPCREQTEPCRHAVDMGINREGRVPTGEQQHARDSFGADAGKFRQECACRRHRHTH